MMPRHKKSSSVSRSHRSTLSLSKTEITIHVYDLLPVSEVAHTHLTSFHEHDADTRGMTARPIIVGQSGPAWLNRAASIGVALPCVVPRDWIEPPEYDTSEGALLDDYDNSNDDNSHTLKKSTDPHLLMEDNDSNEDDEWDSAEERRRGGSGKGKQALRDSAGRRLPPAERAIR
ncbi:hypothetical protein Lal_00012849 [Lupinus albus]|nr:hypothetical protein Lal_00012849 [Lupinus albus]